MRVPSRSDRRAGDLRAAYFDTSRAETELGWQARIPLREGIAQTVEAFRREFNAQRPALQTGTLAD